MSPPESHDTPAGLHCEHVAARYGAMQACSEITFDVKPGELVALIGPNGAGKTSLLGALNGTVSSTGRISLDGTEIHTLPAWRRVGTGLATVPDNRGLFPSLTVAENLRLGGLLSGKEHRERAIEGAVSLFPFLRDRWREVAGALSGGQQQMLGIAKCMACSPRALLLDEPTQGLAPIIVDELAEVLRGLRARGLPILLVEQNHYLVEAVADRFIVLVEGKVVLTGAADELADREKIASLYLQHRQHDSVHQ